MTEQELHKLISDQALRIAKLEKALNQIADWNLPHIADEEGKLYPFEVMRGSNGARDYVKDLAKKALEK